VKRPVAARVPIKFTLLLVALPFVVGEWFPFSKFGMFTILRDTGTYYYITDEADRPIATLPELGFSVGFVKKLYRSTWSQLRRSEWTPPEVEKAGSPVPAIDREAGVRLLRYLLRHRPPLEEDRASYKELRLYCVTVRRQGHEFVRARELVSLLAVSDEAR